MKIDWNRKLSSRKFWTAIIDFVGMLIIALTRDENLAAEVAALIMAGAAVVAYIISEGFTDAAKEKKNVAFITPSYEPEEDEQENVD